jgi:peptidoglycan/xylan/chitin deacetylase (PgdA/CDA1 family)
VKYIKYLVVIAILALLTFLPAAADDNMLANPSVEAVAASQPANWRADKWGNNQTTLTHQSEGRTGGKSLLITMAQHVDGDAKWMPDAVTVAPNTSYTYTSYYKSNVATEIDLQYTHTDGSVSYAYIQQVPASGDWQVLTSVFTTPANVTKVTPLHIISQPGWLQTDDFSLAPTVQAPPADEENLVANPSFATPNGMTPADWNKNAWGDIAAQFTYENTGRTDARRVSVNVTQQMSGDAKWYAQPVNVQPNKTYLYRDYYKSTADSRVVVAFIDEAGNYTYAEVAGAAASADWKQYQTTFTVPAGAVKATVFHLLDRVGTLTIDDVLLQVALPNSPAPVVPNASLEQVSGTQPASWQHNNWGQNNATFDYTNDGRSGNKSVKVTLNNYVSGDGKWFFDPINTLTPDAQYRFSVWYKTNVIPQAVMMYLEADGSDHYIGMPAPQPGPNSATQWQQYSDAFSVPDDAVAVSVFMFINQNGWLQTDDYNISEYQPNGFNRPLLTLTFDDGHEDNVTTALPLLNQYGFKTTQCYATTFIEGIPEAVANVHAFQSSGHELCSHAVTHPFLTSLSNNDLIYELQHSRQYLESITGVAVDNFASPYGDYNAAVNNAIDDYYGSHRTVEEGYNSKDNFDIYRLRVQNVLDATSAQQINQWIARAQADNTWLILVYHRVADDPGPYETYTNVFAEHLQAIDQSGIEVKTYRDALTEVTSQL